MTQFCASESKVRHNNSNINSSDLEMKGETRKKVRKKRCFICLFVCYIGIEGGMAVGRQVRTFLFWLFLCESKLNVYLGFRGDTMGKRQDKRFLLCKAECPPSGKQQTESQLQGERENEKYRVCLRLQPDEVVPVVNSFFSVSCLNTVEKEEEGKNKVWRAT